MAADHNRNARQSGRGNQRQVGVEIERVRHLHVVVPQMTAQALASTEGLPAIEAAAEVEFGNLSKVRGQRAISSNTSQVKLEGFRTETRGEDSELSLRSVCFEG